MHGAGKEKGWFEKEDGEQIEGDICKTCHKILCTCEYEKDQVRGGVGG